MTGSLRTCSYLGATAGARLMGTVYMPLRGPTRVQRQLIVRVVGALEKHGRQAGMRWGRSGQVHVSWPA
jgi:hypothetical protein